MNEGIVYVLTNPAMPKMVQFGKQIAAVYRDKADDIVVDERVGDLMGLLDISLEDAEDVMRSVNDPSSTGAVVINGKRHTTARVKE